MHFKKLRVHGFKSFVDPVEMDIEPGITGIVGPNGCGKSNVVEALRWVMGEASAKRMRGGEMDDVIFGGSGGRPRRNNADVAIIMDNADRKAPAAFNDSDELEITRRIDRGQGSTYRINGKDVRARDVQLLFADLATGANSTAIVSQGRIGALIGAKPTDRRTMLEEAAGIRGLHSRRHEAELRLRAAETNLERLEDVIGALEAQYTGLQRQARQANRYRKIAEQLRSQEAILLHLRWSEAQTALDSARQAYSDAEAVVAERTQIAADAARAQADAQTALPELRQAEAEAAARLQAQVIAERQLQSEADRVAEALADLETRLAQIATDADRERALASDAAEALTRLDAEKDDIESQQAAESVTADRIRLERDEADKAVAEKEEALDSLNEQVAAAEAQRSSLTRQIEEARQRVIFLQQRAADVVRETQSLTEQIAEAGDFETARTQRTAAESALAATREASEAADARREEAERGAEAARTALSAAESETRIELDAARNAARDAVSEAERQARDAVAAAERNGQACITTAERAHAVLAAEAQALQDVLSHDDSDAAPVLDSIDVATGYETALGAALGDDLDAALVQDAARHWVDLGALPTGTPELLSGVSSLSNSVDAPPALTRRLSRVGLVEDEADAARLQVHLTPGQLLVSKDGGVWRWDGLRVRPGTATATAKRLEQRGRLAALREELKSAEAAHTAATTEAEATVASVRQSAETALSEARTASERAVRDAEEKSEAKLSSLRRDAEAAAAALGEAASRSAEARHALQWAYETTAGARGSLAELEQRIAEDRSRLVSLEEDSARVSTETAEAEDRIAAAEKALKVLEDPAVLRDSLNRTRTALAELRARQIEKRTTFEQHEREARARTDRLAAIEEEAVSWRTRAKGAEQRLSDLTERKHQAEQDQEALQARPAEIESQCADLRDTIAMCDAERQQAADRLAMAEGGQRDADQTLKTAEQALAQARETRIRREAEVEQTTQIAATVAERIREKLDCAPDAALEESGLKPDADLPLPEDVERRIERLTRERENIGAVNLRAEQEAAELEEQIASMQSERDDLIAAINRLRQGIGALNREGRERLLRAFEEVDTHFRELFLQIFGGGEAHLKLTESDDPLEAGLEIFASPPGKKMQVLSLLSGGEQALTALALLFGVFLTNPAPICVLDEVDAPLDDTNVDRFCQMLDRISAAGTTRFLVVTHHRMTMARVDRLFGVTMAERGVSQLVSVDLRQAERLREAG